MRHVWLDERVQLRRYITVMDVVSLLQEYKAELSSIALPLVGGLLKYFLSPKSKVLYTKSHGFCYSLKNPDGTANLVYTESYFFINKGRKPAEKIEIVLGRRPQNYAIWPQRDYVPVENPEGFFVIKTEWLSRNESFTLNMFEISVQPPMLTNVRTSEGTSKNINTAPVQIFPKWINYSIIFLFFAGVCVTLYGVFKFLIFLLS